MRTSAAPLQCYCMSCDCTYHVNRATRRVALSREPIYVKRSGARLKWAAAGPRPSFASPTRRRQRGQPLDEPGRNIPISRSLVALLNRKPYSRTTSANLFPSAASLETRRRHPRDALRTTPGSPSTLFRSRDPRIDTPVTLESRSSRDSPLPCARYDDVSRLYAYGAALQRPAAAAPSCSIQPDVRERAPAWDARDAVS